MFLYQKAREWASINTAQERFTMICNTPFPSLLGLFYETALGGTMNLSKPFWWRLAMVNFGGGGWRYFSCPVFVRASDAEEVAIEIAKIVRGWNPDIQILAEEPAEPQGPCAGSNQVYFQTGRAFERLYKPQPVAA